ncbi:hypothetical protein NMG60_11033961 [Bertholletia excelsa]
MFGKTFWGTFCLTYAHTRRPADYYHEPGTRRKFRSLKSVERYITGEEYAPSSGGVKLSNYVRGSSSRKWIASGGMLLRLENESEQCQLALMGPTTRTATSSFSLPDGWIVEEVPRRRDSTVDKYYYEPGTGRRFRSLVSVERYLAEEGDYNAPLSQLFKLKNRVKNSGSVNKAKTSTSNFAEPPAKINWVLADSGGSKWNPFLGESMVPAPVKQQWATKFNLAFKESNCAAPNFEC